VVFSNLDSVYKISIAFKVFQISFGTSQRLEGCRDGQPHTTTGASTKLALVNLSAEIDGMLGVFWSESNHTIVFPYRIIIQQKLAHVKEKMHKS